MNFLVLKLPRTGSSMLGTVLDRHPEVVCTNEVLNDVQNAELLTKTKHLAACFSEAGDNTGKPITGATLNPFKYGLKPRQLRKAIASIEESSTGSQRFKIVTLLRRNKLRQAVSAYLSIERGRWLSDRRQLRGKPDPRVEVDFRRLQRMTFKYWRQSFKLARFAKALSREHLSLQYEELSDQPAATVQRVFEFLGAKEVGEDFDFTAGFRKLAPDDLRESIANFDDIRRFPLLRFFLD